MQIRMKLTVAAVLLAVGGGALAADWGNLLKGVLQQSMATPPQQAPVQQPVQAPVQQPVGNAKEQAILGLLGTLVQKESPDEEEKQIGAQIAGNLLGAVPLVNDSNLQKYVNLVGRWVALQSERPDLEWHFGVVETEDINAFAAPGGYILLTKGLYRKLNNEAELAGVLGHEIGHVIKKHHLDVLKKSKQIGALGVIAGQWAAKKKDAMQSQLLQNVIGNGAEIVARGLDKDAEFEADRIGMVLSARAGYDSFGLPTVLQEIGHIPAKDNRMALLYKTHPHPEVRFEKLAEAVGERLDSVEPGKQLENRFYRIR